MDVRLEQLQVGYGSGNYSWSLFRLASQQRLLLDGIFDLFSCLLQVASDLVAFALSLKRPIVCGLTGGVLDTPLRFLSFVLGFIDG
jgi:hypothetical protein